MAAEDLVSVLFPDQIACAENLSGSARDPDHPLVRQTLHDCLHEAMDIDGLIALLRKVEGGEIKVLTRDLPHPSMLAMKSSPHGPMPISTTRRWKSGARSRGGATLARSAERRGVRASSIRSPSRSCARKRGRIHRAPTSARWP